MPTPIKLGTSVASASRICLAAVTASLAVDHAAGTIANLQLMASGREAKGHGFWIDDKTLETALEVVKSKGGQLKAYVTHDHSGPGTWYWSQDGSELDVCGFFSAISVQKSQLVAGLCEFYSSFRTDPEDKRRYDRLMEMAQKTPNLIGLSVEVWGYVVYVAKDGVEYAQRPEGVELNYDGMPALRVTEMFAAAFVSDGAATDGLHAKLADGRKKKPKGLGARLLALLTSLGAEEEEAAAPAAPAAAATADSPEGSPENAVHTAAPIKQPAPPSTDSSTMKILNEIKKCFGADKSRLAKAMNILGEAADPATLTIEAVSLQVVESDLAGVRLELTTANKRVTDLEAEKATFAADKAKLEKQVETLKNGGHRGVDLGAGGAAGGAGGSDDVNPWAPGSINYTLQVQLLRDEPARAEALKAAAAGLKAGAKGSPAKA